MCYKVCDKLLIWINFCFFILFDFYIKIDKNLSKLNFLGLLWVKIIRFRIIFNWKTTSLVDMENEIYSIGELKETRDEFSHIFVLWKEFAKYLSIKSFYSNFDVYEWKKLLFLMSAAIHLFKKLCIILKSQSIVQFLVKSLLILWILMKNPNKFWDILKNNILWSDFEKISFLEMIDFWSFIIYSE